MQMNLQAGFSDEIHEAQHVFRQALTAMSEPGRQVSMPAMNALASMDSSVFALLLALCDEQSKVFLSEHFSQTIIQQNLVFHCACQLVTDVNQADFVVLSSEDLDILPQVRQGSDRDPELGATVIMQLTSLADGRGIVLSGPGILGSRSISPSISERFWLLREQCLHFPRGIDFFFCANQQVMALPRTTQCKEQSVCMSP